MALLSICVGRRSGEGFGVKDLSLLLREVIWGWEGALECWGVERGDQGSLLLVPQAGMC